MPALTMTESSESVGSHDRNHYVAMVAHELRNPLLPILTAAAIIKRRPLDAELVKRSADIIDRQARILSRRIDDLMDVSRVQMGKLHMTRSQVSVAEILRQCLETVAPMLAQRGQALLISVSPGPMELNADAARLSQALQNLVANAAKFSGKGTEIRVHAERDGGDAVLTVRDSGIGLEPAELESIFRLFSQADQGSSAASNTGLGIGLYLARSFVEAHEGTVTAASGGRNAGSTFTLRVPCLAFDPQATSIAQRSPSSRSVSFLTTA